MPSCRPRHHDGVLADRDVRDERTKAGGVDWVVYVAIWVGGLGSGGAERNAEDADAAIRDAVAGVGDHDLVEGGREVGPDWGDGLGILNDAIGDTGVHLIVLGIDDADGIRTIVQDEGPAGVRGHDSVDRIDADGQRARRGVGADLQ